jgi:hypothetical protein
LIRFGGGGGGINALSGGRFATIWDGAGEAIIFDVQEKDDKIAKGERKILGDVVSGISLIPFKQSDFG